MSENKIAIVTGANKGLGFSIVKGLCKKLDGIVYLTSRDDKRGEAACTELRNLGLNPRYHQLDVTDKDSVERFRTFIQKEHGFVDIIINNAGVLFLKDATEPKRYQAEKTVTVNFFSLVNFTEEMLPLIKDGGKIVNISSSSGHLSRIPSDDLKNKFKSYSIKDLKNLMSSYVEDVLENKEIVKGWGDSSYVVSKVGVNAYTFLLERSLKSRGIKCYCVHPGYVQSDMTRGSGDRTPDEGAAIPLKPVLEDLEGGLYIWQNGQSVPWDGPDPRGYIDGKKL